MSDVCVMCSLYFIKCVSRNYLVSSSSNLACKCPTPFPVLCFFARKIENFSFSLHPGYFLYTYNIIIDAFKLKTRIQKFRISLSLIFNTMRMLTFTCFDDIIGKIRNDRVTIYRMNSAQASAFSIQRGNSIKTFSLFL